MQSYLMKVTETTIYEFVVDAEDREDAHHLAYEEVAHGERTGELDYSTQVLKTSKSRRDPKTVPRSDLYGKEVE